MFIVLLLLAACGLPSAWLAAAHAAGIVDPEVHRQLLQEGRARVIAEIWLSSGVHTPEGLLPGAAVNAQRAEIATAQAQLLARLVGRSHQVLHRYETIPFVALEVGPDALLELEGAPFLVRRVVRDTLHVPTLPQSVPLIGANQAWSRGFDGTGTMVAIVDTGVDSSHPFLAGKVVEEACYSSTTSQSTTVCPNGQSQQIGAGAGVPCTFGTCWHGTHVAGIAAGNGAGAGVTFSGVAKGAQIMAVQVFSKFSSTSDCGGPAPCPLAWTSDIIAGLERVYAVRGARNIASANLSLGGDQLFTSSCDTDPTKSIIDNLRSAGIATVIAAGNNGSTNSMSSPGCVSSAISVGSTTKSDVVSSFSNVSSLMSLFAPGESITSSVPGGGFGVASGTSMATPHVTGTWAILKQAAPNATVAQILSALQTTGVPITDTRPGGTVVAPRIQVANALAVFVPPSSCPCSLWSGAASPGVIDAVDPTPVQLGVRFQSDSAGYITALRFYKSAANAGPHVGYLWTSTGTLLASVTFTNETASGWQQMALPTPVAITANTQYVASYYTPSGHFSYDRFYFASAGVNTAPLHAPAGTNGVYTYAGSTFPNGTYQTSNYWVDVVFSTSAQPPPPPPSCPCSLWGGTASPGVIDAGDPTPVQLGVRFQSDSAGYITALRFYKSAANTGPHVGYLWTSTGTLLASVTFTNETASGWQQMALPTPVAISANTQYVASYYTPSGHFSYDRFYFASAGVDPVPLHAPAGSNNGVATYAGSSFPNGSYESTNYWVDVVFTTNAQPPPPPSCPCSLWDGTAIPAVIDAGDPTPVQLGVRFQSDIAGYVTALRFYKSAANTGPHVGYLWTDTGTLLASVSFTNETASGWQQMALPTPVAITANTQYVASYYTPSGHFSYDRFYFASAGIDDVPLHAPAGSNNGVATYAGSSFPNASYQSSNYWVDVVFSPSPQ